MVSSFIASIIFASGTPAVALDISEAQAQAIAQSFRTFAASAGGQTIIGPTPSSTPGIFDPEPDGGVHELLFEDGTARISKASGRIHGFSLDAATGFSTSWDAEHALSPSQLAELSNMYYTEAGFTGSVTPFLNVQDNHLGGPPNVWHSVVHQYQSGVELYKKYDAWFDVEHVSGRLVWMAIPPAPFPAINLTSNVSSMTALLNFTSYLYQKTGETGFIVRNPMHLVIWVPDGDDLTNGFNELTPIYNMYKTLNQGYLTYWCLLESTQSSMGKGLPRWFFGHVDSHTGQVLGAYVPSAFGGTPDKPRTAIGWDLGIGPIEILSGSKGVLVPKADVLAIEKPSAAPKSGKQVTLKRGKLLLICTFDPKSGLIWKTGGVGYGMPNDALLTALRRVCK